MGGDLEARRLQTHVRCQDGPLLHYRVVRGLSAATSRDGPVHRCAMESLATASATSVKPAPAAFSGSCSCRSCSCSYISTAAFTAAFIVVTAAAAASAGQCPPTIPATAAAAAAPLVHYYRDFIRVQKLRKEQFVVLSMDRKEDFGA